MDDANRAEREGIEATIRSAFAGVQLGSGTSLQQARLINDYAELSAAEWAAIPRLETTDDWTRIPDGELLCDALVHLDAEGLRYYLPALMLWLLDHHDDEGMDWGSDAAETISATMFAQAPSYEFSEQPREIYESFTPEQRTAIARYVEALPRLVELDHEEAAQIYWAGQVFWSRFLPEAST